jgi:hypothetical protein
VGATFIILNSIYHNIHPYPKPEDIGWLFETLAGPLAIIIAVLIFIYEQGYENSRRRHDESQKIIRTCDSILRELEDIETALQDPKSPRVDYPHFGAGKIYRCTPGHQCLQEYFTVGSIFILLCRNSKSVIQTLYKD